MKIYNKSRMLLVSSIMTALSGCGGSSDDYNPPVPPNMSAPTHGGDISLSFHEKDPLFFVELLGTPEGRSVGDGVAYDADGNYLSVTDVSIEVSGPRAEEIMEDGLELAGNRLGVRPLAVAPNLDTGEMHTAVVSFNISDGANKTPRTATITFEGEDFAPVIANSLVVNFTRDSGAGSVDGLSDVTDADEEPLRVSNILADSDNPYSLPVTIGEDGSTINIDVAAVESVIPDGQKVTFKFTYTVSDHRFDLQRDLTVNVLGVQDIAGAPLILDYFLSETVNETDGMVEIDLAQQVDEREGDAVVVSDIMLDGDVFTESFSTRVEENTLYFNPNAYFDEIAADGFKEFRFTMKVADDQGNMADGERELLIRVNGVESNLLAANGMDVGFENDAAGFVPTFCDAGAEITSSIVANGNGALQMLGAPCYYATTSSVFPDMELGGKYYFHYNVYVGAGDASPYIMLSADPNGSHNFWVGARPYHPADSTWRPIMIEYDTMGGYLATANDNGETPMDIADQLRLFVMSAWMGNDGMPVFDDLTFTRYDDIEGVDILSGNPGMFEDDTFIPSTTGGGTVDVRLDPNNADNHVLFVDTTNATGEVKISFPVQNGGVVSGGRYRISYDIQYLNYATNRQAGTDTNITEGGAYSLDVVFTNPDSEDTFMVTSSIWNGPEYGQVQSLADEASHYRGFGVDTNWDSDNVTVDFILKGEDAQYIIDNIEIVRIP